MSETTTPTAPTPEVTTATKSVAEVIGEVKLDQRFKEYPMAIRNRVKKGSSGAEVYSLINVQIPAEDLLPLLTTHLNVDGARVLENFLIRDVIIPACNDATAEAYTAAGADGEPSLDLEKFVSTFWEYFLPADRRRAGGVTVKDLRERLSAVMPQFASAVQANTEEEQRYMTALEAAIKTRSPAPNKADFVKEETVNRVRQLLLEVTELNAQIEKKSRGIGGGGRPKGSKNKTQVAPVASA